MSLISLHKRLGRLSVILASTIGIALNVQAATYYFDTNGETIGFGNSDATITTAGIWNTDSTGTGPTISPALVDGDHLHFGTASYGYSGTAGGGRKLSGSIWIGSASGAITLNGGWELVGTAGNGIRSSSTTSVLVSGFLSGNAGSISQTGSGVLTLSRTDNTVGSATDAQNGVTTISGGGTIRAAMLSNSGVASSIGRGGVNATRLIFNNGTLIHYGGAASSTDRNFTIQAGGATIANDSANSSHTLTWSGRPTLDAVADRLLTLGGTNTGTNTFSGLLANNSTGKLSLTKSGAGKWLLANANTYTGTTTLNGGALGATGGFTSSVGTLMVAGNSTIDLGDGLSSLQFADSSGETWTDAMQLTLTGELGPTTLRFGTTKDSLTSIQRSRINYNGKMIKLTETGYVELAPPSGTIILIR